MKSHKKGNPGVVLRGEKTFNPRLFTTVFAALSLFTFSYTAYSQDDREYAGQRYENRQSGPVEQSIVPTVAPYSEDVRNNILIATQYPEVLDKVARIREYTTQGFQATIQDYPQKKQNWFYEVSRYPELMHTLATLPRKQSKDQINGLLSNPSKELQEAAWKLYHNHHNDLVAVDNLNQQAITSFSDLIRPLSSDAQDAFKTLQEMPDVLSILNDHSDLTARLGDEFKNDPDGTRQKLADAHDKIEAENKQDLDNYKKELAQDPQAQQEYDQAAQQYAQSNGYSYPAPTGDKVINYYNNPYSYWFGYPSWYGSPMWYPGAFGFGGGMYYGMGLYGYGFPTLGFSSWFFGGAYRYYPHLYRRYGNYYRNHYISRGRYISPRNGFIGAAGRHYNPEMGGRSNWLSSPRTYNNAGRGYSQGARTMPNQGSSNRSYSAPRTYNNAPRSYNNGGSNFRSPSYGGGYSRGGYSGGGSRGGGGARGGRR